MLQGCPKSDLDAHLLGASVFLILSVKLFHTVEWCFWLAGTDWWWPVVLKLAYEDHEHHFVTQ